MSLQFATRLLAKTALAASLVAIASPSLAQQAGIQVALVDANTGEPVANAEVRIENAEIGFSRTIQSDELGLARVEGLTTAGTYRVTTSAGDEYAADQQASVTLRANYTSRSDEH